MRGIFHGAIVIVGAVFGGCVGAVLGLAACLVLRDALQWPMPLARIVLIASIFAAGGAAMSVLIDLWRWRFSAARASSDSGPPVER
jgi:hypothetical protein